MRRVNSGAMLAVTSIILGAGGGLAWVQVSSPHSGRVAAHGQISPVQVAKQAARLAARLAPENLFDATDVSYQSARLPIQNAGPFWSPQSLFCPPSPQRPPRPRAVRREWIAECFNKQGDRLTFAWNADTGRLIRLSRTILHEARGSKELTADAALSAAFRQLRDLHLVDAGPSWHLARTPERNAVAWALLLGSGPQRLTAFIDRRSGRLLYACLRW